MSFDPALRLFRALWQRLSPALLVARFGLWLQGFGTGRVAGHVHTLRFAGKAVQLCRGTGIEIGALHRRLPLAANVLYLDRLTTAQLRREYAGDPREPEIAPVHLVADAARYPFIDDGAFDFVASSHVLEHAANPPRQLQEWLRIVRSGGIVYVIVPDMRHCFDRNRQATPLAHFVDEFERDVASISIEHYRDCIHNSEETHRLAEDEREALVARSFETQRSIHAHTFTEDSMRQFLDSFAARLAFDLVHFEADGMNLHFAVRKRG